MDIHTVCDYIILKLSLGGVPLNNLKLQKLAYYVQSWHLAIHKETLVYAKFQAWVHGPVNREIYSRFVEYKSLYSPVDMSDVDTDRFNPDQMSVHARSHIDMVLENYANYSGSQLEVMTHQEAPWISARDTYHPAERCEVDIDENLMMSFYGKRLATQ